MSLPDALLQMPVTTVITVVCCALWFYQWNWGVHAASVGMNYQLVVEKGHLWRTLTATFSHLDLMHILFNAMSLWSCGMAEVAWGSLYYLRATFALLVGCLFLPA